MLGEPPHRIGAGAEERGVPEGHDARIAERQVERRSANRNRGEQLDTEAEVSGKNEIEREQQNPGDRLPDPDAGGG